MARLALVLTQLFLLTLGFHSFTALSEVGSSVAISVRAPHKAKFSRAEEVRRRCPQLALRKEEPDPKSGRRRPLMKRLSFRNGDWEEAERQSEDPPIMYFEGLRQFEAPAKLKLGSLWVTEVSSKPGSERDISGTLELMIMDGRSEYTLGRSELGNGFQMAPGFSFLMIEVEGIYQQGLHEDVVCMLGCTNRPVGNSSNLERDCDISVKLSYPIKSNLTSRTIRGTVDSLLSPRGFAAITLSSQVTSRLDYEATATDLVSTACKGVPPNAPADAYKATLPEFCQLSRSYLSDSLLDIDTNIKCNYTTEYCSKVGPFSGYALDSPFLEDYNASRVQILVQSFRSPCYLSAEEAQEDLPVSFVLRLVPADESKSVARVRSALDGQTLVAEGYWRSGSDTVCMAGCKLDRTSGRADVCYARICLYIPLSMSIKRRNIFEGSISSLLPRDNDESFYPLSFHVSLEHNRNLPYMLSSTLRYNYSKLDEAVAVLTKYEPDSGSHKVTWFKYPELIGEESGHYQSLASDLSLSYSLKKDHGKSAFSFVVFELVAMDRYLSFLWAVSDMPTLSSVNDTIVSETDSGWSHRPQEQRRYLNCSGTLTFTGVNLTQSPVLKIFTEGYYSPNQGKMYMVGCRSVQAAWQDMKDSSFDLTEGMDCQIEIVLSYPTNVAAWVLNPGVKVKVHSRRPDDDPFHFVDIDAETSAVLYKKQREDLISRKGVEGVLSILTLSMMVICLISQVLYLENHMQSTPYISLLMLGVQAMGYAIPLVTGAESLLKRKFTYRGEYFFQEAGWTQLIIYLDKILTLFALLVVLRLFEKVWRERTAAARQQPPGSAPHERNVVVICFIIHTLGFLSVMGLHSLHSTSDRVERTKEPGTLYSGLESQPKFGNNVSEASYGLYDVMHMGPVWSKVLQEYAGLVEDLFLLPQVIAFSLWTIGGKPLRPFYYVGLTLLQIVPHVYDYLRVPGFDSFDYPMYANPTFDFYTHVGNILIPVLALILALLVYLQQRWNGFLRLPSKFHYQPLGQKTGETELVTNNGRNHLPSIPEDDE